MPKTLCQFLIATSAVIWLSGCTTATNKQVAESQKIALTPQQFLAKVRILKKDQEQTTIKGIGNVWQGDLPIFNGAGL